LTTSEQKQVIVDPTEEQAGAPRNHWDPSPQSHVHVGTPVPRPSYIVLLGVHGPSVD